MLSAQAFAEIARGFSSEVEIDLVAVRAERLRLKDELAELERKMDGYLTELGY